MLIRLILVVSVWCGGGIAMSAAESLAPASAPTAGLRVAMFDVDATPPVGSMMAYDAVTNRWELGLRARGIVLLGAEEPIVLCAVDWIGIGNEGHDVFRSALARAAATSRERVAVHSLHQHEASADHRRRRELEGRVRRVATRETSHHGTA